MVFTWSVICSMVAELRGFLVPLVWTRTVVGELECITISYLSVMKVNIYCLYLHSFLPFTKIYGYLYCSFLEDESNELPKLILTEEDQQILRESVKDAQIDYQQLELTDTLGEGAYTYVAADTFVSIYSTSNIWLLIHKYSKWSFV